MPRFNAFVLILLTAAAFARAEEVTYTIDPTQSSLSIGGTLTNNSPSPQATGSTATTYSGTIKANRVANTIEFINGSVIDAIIKGNYQPRADATPGSQPADYGRQAPNQFFTTTLESFRDLFLDLSSDAPITITSGSFPSGDFAITIDSGESDFSYGTGFGEVDLSGKGTANGASTPSTIEVVDQTEKITLRITTGPISYNVINSFDSTLTFSGTLVATRDLTPIPEPSSTALALLAAAALFRRHR
jgi:hypothetical protein